MKSAVDKDNIAKSFMPVVLRRYRDAAGLSQQQLADAVEITKSYVSSLELGYRAPHLNLLIKIAKVLHVRPGELVDAMMEEAEK
jgi:transcriptional regulator with XRE-family HTH domain